MNTEGAMFIFSLLCGTIFIDHVRCFDYKKLDEFERKLDREGLDMIHNMYENYDSRMKRDTTTDRNYKEIAHETVHSRARRSLIMEQVKAAQKTGNREELYLRSSLPYLKLRQIYDPTDIIPITLTLDPPHNAMEKPMFFAVANYRDESGSYDSAVLILRYNDTTANFTVHQYLNEYAPYELESFSGKISLVSHKNFFAVAGFIEDEADRNASTKQPQVSIYEIGPPPFFVFERIQEFKHSVRAIKYIQISTSAHLVLGMYYQITRNGRQYSSPSQLLILRYDLGSNLFHFHSSLPGSGVTDIECFTVRDKTYLTVANYRDSIGRLGILSFIYLYNEQTRGFELIQYLSTNGARDIEHFTLANEKYLVVANEARGTTRNKTFDVESDVYKLSNGRFELIQKLSTSGAVKWKGISVPNCKQDVLLVYSDQRDNVDQVGIFTFSHHEEMFGAEQFYIYDLDLVRPTFRPRARALSAYSLQDHDTGEYSLFLIIGATEIEEGYTIYKLSYDIVLTDSPLDAFKRDVQEQLEILRITLNEVKTLLTKAKTTLLDVVTKTDTDTITGTKSIMNNMVAQHAHINTLNITEGSILFLKGNKTYRADPAVTPRVSISDLKANISEHNASLRALLEQEGKFVYTNVDQNVSSYITFNRLETGDVTVRNDVTVISDRIDNRNLSDIDDIVMYDEDVNITGYKNLSHSIDTNSVIVYGKVNGLKFSSDLVLQGIDQSVTVQKVFTKSVNITANLMVGEVNGIDILKDALFVNRPGYVEDTTTFISSVVARNMSVEKINGFDMDIMIADRVTKSTEQNITGVKTFEEITSNGNVVINGTINGIDIDELKKKLESQTNISELHGDKVFTEDITITENIVIEDGINDLSLPDDVVLKSSTQTILADKHYANEVTFNYVYVQGEIDGMNLRDFVSLDTDQEIHDMKTFQRISLTSDVHLLDTNTVDGIDLSSFAKNIVTTTDPESITHLSFADTLVISNSSINKVNNETLSSFKEILDTCLHVNADQNVTTYIQISNDVAVSRNLTARYINNFSYPGDFATTSGSQTFDANKTFDDDVVLTSVRVDGTVNDIVVGVFNDNIVTDNDGVVSGDKTIRGNVYVNGTLDTNEKLNGLNFSKDLLLYETEQDVTARKHFGVLDFSDQEVTVIGDIHVETTIDGVDLSELELSGMTVSKNETITGTKCFANTDYNRSVDQINGVDLSALRDDIVTLNTDQVIRSEKVFKRIMLEENLNTTSTVDGVDVSELKNKMVLSNQKNTVIGRVVFNQSLLINGNLTARLIDGTNMESIRLDFVSLSDDVGLAYLTVTGNVFTNTLNATSINDVALDDIVYRSTHQVISGSKRFINASIGNLGVHGNINGVNLTGLRDTVVFKDADQTIFGGKVFKDVVEIRGSLNSSGNVNGIDLRNWDIARSTGNTFQVIEGVKTFSGETTIDHVTVEGTVNNRNITSLFRDAVLSDENNTIDHVVFGDGIAVHGDVGVNGSVKLLGLMNDVNLTTFDEVVLKTVGEQDLRSKYFNDVIRVSNINLTGFVNGLNVSEDLVTKGTAQNIRGLKRFNSMTFANDVIAERLVSGVNMTELATNTLFKYTNDTQWIRGTKYFNNGVGMDHVTTDGFVDGLNITRSVFVTLRSQQVIYGRKHLTSDFITDYVTVAGNVAGVNLVNFNRSRVLLFGNQTMTSDVLFYHDVVVDKDIVISGLVNRIDLSTFNRTSPVINETELGNSRTSLTNTLSNQCRALTYVKDSLIGSAYHFDYFVERQSIRDSNIQHAEYFEIAGEAFLAISISGNRVSHCTNSMVARWNETTYISEHQAIPTSGVMKMVYFRTAWNVSYILVVNSKSGCAGIEGPSELHRWNATSSQFQLATPLPTMNAVDAVVHQEDNYVIIFISNANNTLSSWILTPTGVSPYSTLDDYPVTAHVFNVNQIPRIAVASRSQETSSNGYVNIYKITGGNMTRVQSIATKGASSVTSFGANGVKYLIVANDRAFSASGLSTYHLTVDIYSYSNYTNSFEWFRSIPTYRAYRVKTYQVGSFSYLAIVHFDQSVSFYQFGLELGFHKVDELRVSGVRGLTYFQPRDRRYVFISSSLHLLPAVSKLMEMNPSGPDQRKVRKTADCRSSP